MKKLFITLLLATSCQAKFSEDADLFENNTQPLFSFGQNILREKSLWLSGYFFNTKGEDYSLFQFNPEALYSFTDWISLLISTNIDHSKNMEVDTSGVEPLQVQVEGALYQHGSRDHYSLISVIGAAYLPTASSGFGPGKTRYFIGSTQSYLNHQWYMFMNQGYFFATTKHQEKMGSQFLFQFGLGHTIYYDDNFLMALLCELDGASTAQNKVSGIPDPNSGGTSIFAGPVLQVSNEHWIFQAGVQAPLYQNLKGNQQKTHYFAGIGLTYYRQFN